MIQQFREQKLTRWLIAGLLFVIVISIANRIISSPFDFDEGVGLILSRIIFQTGKYSSYETVFDPVITVGPTVYFPTALSLVFGNVFIPRFIILIYSSLLISIVVSKFLKENISKILFLCLLCLTPYYFYFSAHVLGEVPAIFFSLTGLYFLNNKKYYLSGTFLALSIITKNILLLSMAPAIYLLYTQKREISLKKILSLIAPFFLINGAWEIYKLQTFHFSAERYLENLFQFMRYNKSITRIHLEYLPDRFAMLGGTFGINGVVFLLLMVSLSLYSFTINHSHLLKSIALFTLIYLIYFFLLGSTIWYRHFFPAVIFFIIILADITATIRLSKLSLIPIVLTVCIGLICPPNTSKYLLQQNLLPMFDQVGDSFFSKSNILNQQLETADYISSYLSKEKISGVVWYNAPEISYLSGKQILRSPEDDDVYYLISHPFGRLLVPSVDARITKYPFKLTVLDTPLYKIYKKND